MGNVFFGGGKVGMKNPGSRLPSGYTELAYIQSSGAQLIDTEYYPNQNTKVVADAEYLAGDNYPMVCGCYVSSSNQFAIFYTASTWRGWFGSAVVYFAGDYSSGRKTFSLDSSTFSVSGTSSAVSGGNFTSTLPLYLFAMKQSSGIYYHSTMKMYSLQIYESGTLVRDFVPCASSDGSIGMYDLVGAKFYGNGGSGAFTGSEVE